MGDITFLNYGGNAYVISCVQGVSALNHTLAKKQSFGEIYSRHAKTFLTCYEFQNFP
jgi:hypothetical protein